MELDEVLSQGAYMLLYSRYSCVHVEEANALSLFTAQCLNDVAL